MTTNKEHKSQIRSPITVILPLPYDFDEVLELSSHSLLLLLKKVTHSLFGPAFEIKQLFRGANEITDGGMLILPINRLTLKSSDDSPVSPRTVTGL
jgi:hypothetical protein